jgi:hypothetical protein
LSGQAKNLLIVAVVVLTIPLLAVAVLWLRAGKVISVRNDSDTRVEITATVSDGVYVEHTETKTLDSGGSAWFYFFPKITGALALRCVGGGRFGTISLGAEPARFQYSGVVLDSCDSMAKISGLAF